MKPPVFKLEKYFAKHEFSAPYLLCSSDTETLSLKELLSLADEESLVWWEDLFLGYTGAWISTFEKRNCKALPKCW